jgi:hypothetical protein
MINNEFIFYNLREIANSNAEVKNFTIRESNFYNVFDENENDIFSNMSEHDKERVQEEQYDNKEEKDALDVDIGDIDDDDGEYSLEQLSRTYYTNEISE